MPRGKFFYIRSKMNGLVLDVKGGDVEPGTQVHTWEQKDEGNADNQLFWEGRKNGVIRTKINNLVLDIDEDENSLIVNDYDHGKENQKWKLSGDRIENGDSDKALDIAGNESDPGARVCCWGCHGNDNQCWEYVEASTAYFYIKSEMNGKVVDIPKGDDSPGVKPVMWDQGDGQDHQLWYEDSSGNILSKLNDFCLDASKGNSVRMEEGDSGNYEQEWDIEGNKIVSRSDPDKVLDIKKNNDENGAKLCMYEYKGGDNQHWTIEYV